MTTGSGLLFHALILGYDFTEMVAFCGEWNTRHIESFNIAFQKKKTK
jgi:hypothetical protein